MYCLAISYTDVMYFDHIHHPLLSHPAPLNSFFQTGPLLHSCLFSNDPLIFTGVACADISVEILGGASATHQWPHY